MASEKQTQANQAHARKSTGPRSDDGKDRSCSKAPEHDLAGSAVVLPEAEEAAVKVRLAEWFSTLKPSNNKELWLAERIALASVRVERCEWLERDRRKQLSERALHDWD